MKDQTVDRQPLRQSVKAQELKNGLSIGQRAVLKRFVVIQLTCMRPLESSNKQKASEARPLDISKKQKASEALWSELFDCGLKSFAKCEINVQELFAKHEIDVENIASLDRESLQEIISSGRRSTKVDLQDRTKVTTVHHRDSHHRYMVLSIPVTSSSSKSSASMRFLQNSAKHLNDLCHHRILQCFGSYETPHERGIYFEHVLANTVADLTLEYGIELSMELVGSVTYQVLEGLRYLHAGKKIIHNAITCDTICFDTMGVVKIAGFGLSHRISEYETGVPDSLGTYMETGHETFWLAPEIINQENCSYAADIWSLGCLVAEMCTGKRPVSLSAICNSGQAKGKSLTVRELVRVVDEPYKTLLSKMVTIEVKQRSTATLLLDMFKYDKARMDSMDSKFIEGVSPKLVAANMESFYARSCIGPRLTSKNSRKAAAMNSKDL